MLSRESDGGIAQLARACGSYPQCRGFKSPSRYEKIERESLDSLLFFIIAEARGGFGSEDTAGAVSRGATCRWHVLGADGRGAETNPPSRNPYL